MPPGSDPDPEVEAGPVTAADVLVAYLEAGSPHDDEVTAAASDLAWARDDLRLAAAVGGSPADGLSAIRRLRKRLDVWEAHHVRAARLRGLPWRFVARVLGEAKPTVHRRHRDILQRELPTLTDLSALTNPSDPRHAIERLWALEDAYRSGDLSRRQFEVGRASIQAEMTNRRGRGSTPPTSTDPTPDPAR